MGGPLIQVIRRRILQGLDEMEMCHSHGLEDSIFQQGR